jgi:acetyl-CoA synthetase
VPSNATGNEATKIANELRNWVAKEIGPIAKPKDIRFGDNLPKTRSGEIMEKAAALDRQTAICRTVSTQRRQTGEKTTWPPI